MIDDRNSTLLDYIITVLTLLHC